MVNLKKRTNASKILGIFLGFCCLISLAGCSSKKEEVAVDETPTVQSTADTQTTQSYDQFLNTKVLTKVETGLYIKNDEQYEQVGTFAANINLDIDETTTNTSYLKVKGQDYYVNGQDVQTSDRWFTNATHLIPFNKEITTNNKFSIEDVLGNIQATIDQEQTFVVYVMPNDEDPRYGVLFQNGIYYIKSDEVANINDSNVTSEELGDKISVMMYHFFYDASNGETAKDGNDMEVKTFEQQLQSLQDNNYTTLTMREVEYFMEERAQIPTRSVAITIDDGNPSIYKYAYPLITKYKMNATIFIVGGWAGETLPYEFIEMRESGIEPQSHSFLMHQGGCSGQGHGGRLLCVDYDEGVADTIQSFDYVDHGFVYCYPFGDVNDNAKQIVKDAGAKLAFTTEFGQIHQGMDVLELPRIRVSGDESIERFMQNIE